MKNLNKLLGCKIEINNIKYRIIHISGGYSVLCELETTKLILKYYPTDALYQKYENDNQIIIKEEPIVIDFAKMSNKERDEFEKRKEIIKQISDVYGPSYMGLLGRDKKELLIKLQTENNISKVTLWVWIRKYLQSGLNEYSLLDARYHVKEHKKYEYTTKTGRPNKDNMSTGVILTDEVIEQFKEGLDCIKHGEYKTIKYAYNTIIEKYYSYPPNPGDKAVKPYPISKRPTFNQFYYYCKKEFTLYQKELAKRGGMDLNNNMRLLLGSARDEAYRPGIICECDACEIDVSIVSEVDPTQCVGRPIVYIMIDNCTSMILAISVSFENNSYIGLSNMMLNLATDKVEYANEYGIEIEPDIWKSCIIPNTIRCDRGSDFASDKFGKMCARLGIKRDLVPPGTGSMKGIIEEYFHEFQTSLRPYLAGKGLITKKHNSWHHKQAILTMTDFTKLLIENVIIHNQKTLLNYNPTKDMIRKKIVAKPVVLWDYFCDKYSEPKYITDANRIQYIYDSMIDGNARISRIGICFENLVYLNENDEELAELMFNAGNKKKMFKIRFDPRTVNEIYYMRNEKLYIAKLNMNVINSREYENKTWLQYEEFNKKRKAMKKEGKLSNEELDFEAHQVNNFIIDNIKRDSYANDKDINAARKKEKDRTNFESRISNQLPTNMPNNIIPAEKLNKVVIEQDVDDNESDNNTLTNNTTNTITDNQIINNNQTDNNTTKDTLIDKVIQDKLDEEFKPMENLRAALEAHENKGRD